MTNPLSLLLSDDAIILCFHLHAVIGLPLRSLRVQSNLNYVHQYILNYFNIQPQRCPF